MMDHNHHLCKYFFTRSINHNSLVIKNIFDFYIIASKFANIIGIHTCNWFSSTYSIICFYTNNMKIKLFYLFVNQIMLVLIIYIGLKLASRTSLKRKKYVFKLN